MFTGNTECDTCATSVGRGVTLFGVKLFSTIAAVRFSNPNLIMKKSDLANDGSRFRSRDARRDPRIVNLRASAAGSVRDFFPQLTTDWRSATETKL